MIKVGEIIENVLGISFILLLNTSVTPTRDVLNVILIDLLKAGMDILFFPLKIFMEFLFKLF